jgi:hypothetical protein
MQPQTVRFWRPTILPLPEGEGRGEGERGAIWHQPPRIPTVARRLVRANCRSWDQTFLPDGITWLIGCVVPPHPNPLPRGEGMRFGRFSIVGCPRCESSRELFVPGGQRSSLSPRERAGVRGNAARICTNARARHLRCCILFEQIAGHWTKRFYQVE